LKEKKEGRGGGKGRERTSFSPSRSTQFEKKEGGGKKEGKEKKGGMRQKSR